MTDAATLARAKLLVAHSEHYSPLAVWWARRYLALLAERVAET